MTERIENVLFDENNFIVLENNVYLQKEIIYCDYMPKNKNILKMKLNNFFIPENSTINFKILFNNQYPHNDVSYQYITQTKINENQINMKFNDENDQITGSHYILQNFIVNRYDGNEYEVWSKILLIQNYDINIYNTNLDILSIKKLQNNKSFYDISYSAYYVNTSNLQSGVDRKYVDISFSKHEEEDIAEFDDFIVNLYEENGDLVDTSGNEEDISSNTIPKTSNSFRINNLDINKEYIIKVYPVIHTTSNNISKETYKFNLSEFFRLKEIHIFTRNNTNTNNVKNAIISIEYKNTENTEYSIIDKNNGIEVLNSNLNTNHHKFQLTTPNIYKNFKIEINKTYNVDNIESIKLIGDKHTF